MNFFCRRAIILFSLIFLLLVSVHSVLAQSVFQRNLRLGNRGADVTLLQKVLNSDPQTKLASTGPGSPGQETDYFGSLTYGAVTKFQQKYASEILHPLGLWSPTGFVGPSTRAKINSLIPGGNQPIPSPAPGIPSLPALEIPQNSGLGSDIFSQSDEFFVSSISSYTADRGEEITVSGGGFEPSGNTIHFIGSENNNEFIISGLQSNDSSIAFEIPAEIPFGKYEITLGNSRGLAQSAAFLVVTSSESPPRITGITPSEGGYGTEITLEGENFSESGNEIRSSYGILENISLADGTTLKFKVEPFPGAGMADKMRNIDWNIHFYVVNENGISKESAVFKLKI